MKLWPPQPQTPPDQIAANDRPIISADVLALVAELRRMQARPEHDPRRPAHDREAWRQARAAP